MALLKRREMVFKAFGSGIFSLPRDNYFEKSEQSERLEYSHDYHKYISTESNTNSSA